MLSLPEALLSFSLYAMNSCGSLLAQNSIDISSSVVASFFSLVALGTGGVALNRYPSNPCSWIVRNFLTVLSVILAGCFFRWPIWTVYMLLSTCILSKFTHYLPETLDWNAAPALLCVWAFSCVLAFTTKEILSNLHQAARRRFRSVCEGAYGAVVSSISLSWKCLRRAKAPPGADEDDEFSETKSYISGSDDSIDSDDEYDIDNYPLSFFDDENDEGGEDYTYCGQHDVPLIYDEEDDEQYLQDQRFDRDVVHTAIVRRSARLLYCSSYNDKEVY